MVQTKRALSALIVPLAALVLGLSMMTPSTAFAQDEESPGESVEPTERQVELNEQAVRLIASGDAVKALTLLQEANYIGELNVTYLNLGRAYQSIGRCDEARQALEKVPGAPTVESPPPGLVNSRAQSFLEQLDQECEDGSPSEQLSKADPLVPGEDADDAATSEPSTTTRGWVTAGVGVGLGLAAGGLHFSARSQRNQVREPTQNSSGQVTNITQREADAIETRANTLDTVALSTAIVAAGVTGLGVYWLLSSPEPDASVQITPTFGPQSAGFSLGARF